MQDVSSSTKLRSTPSPALAAVGSGQHASVPGTCLPPRPDAAGRPQAGCAAFSPALHGGTLGIPGLAIAELPRKHLQFRWEGTAVSTVEVAPGSRHGPGVLGASQAEQGEHAEQTRHSKGSTTEWGWPFRFFMEI